MALISMPIFNTVVNQRDKIVRACLKSLASTVNWNRHRLFLIDDASSDPETPFIYENFRSFSRDYPDVNPGFNFTLIRNDKNVGTARSVNKGWLHRQPGECCLKVDSDIVFKEAGWLDRLEDCIRRDPTLGIIGLKRKDLMESPDAPKGCWSRSTLMMLHHKPGETWLIVERAPHILGSCQLYNPLLLDKIGFLAAFGPYGLDDSIACSRSEVCGFYNAFYPHYEIDHIDPGGTAYQTWKEKHAGDKMFKFDRLKAGLVTGQIEPYFGPSVDLDEVFDWK